MNVPVGYLSRIDHPSSVLVLGSDFDALSEAMTRLLRSDLAPVVQTLSWRHTAPPRAVPWHCCGVLLNFAIADLADARLRDWVAWCIQATYKRPEFRIFWSTDGDIDAAAENDEPIRKLRDRVQGLAGDALPGDLVRNISSHVVTATELRVYERFERVRDTLMLAMSRLATAAQLGFAAIALVALAAESWPWLSRAVADLTWLRPTLAFATGALAFPLSAIAWSVQTARRREGELVAMTDTMATAVHRRFDRWLFGAAAGGLAVLWLATSATTPAPWVYVGLAAGLPIDLMRRWKFMVLRRRICGLSRRVSVTHAPSPLRAAWSSVQTAGILRNPLNFPLSTASQPRFFISYSERSEWSCSTAQALHQRLKDASERSFLAKATIDAGAVWRNEIDRALTRADIFVAVVDSAAAKRTWPDAELAAAIESRLRLGEPALLVIAEPQWLLATSSSELPAFQCVRAGWQGTADNSVGGAAVICVDNVDALLPRIRVWLSMHRRAAVLSSEQTRRFGILFTPLLLLADSTFSLFAQAGGVLSGILTLIGLRIDFSLATRLSPFASLVILALLLGSSARYAIAWRFEMPRTRAFRRFANGAVFTVLALALFIKPMALVATPLTLAWAILAFVVGWWRAAAWLDLWNEMSPQSLQSIATR